tara:strand:- start:373 stop:555 length:183 start_codon:yes stop_codon:yes gene_type:complete
VVEVLELIEVLENQQALVVLVAALMEHQLLAPKIQHQMPISPLVVEEVVVVPVVAEVEMM